MTECYKVCNKKYSVTNPQRGYCKKGCDSEEETLFDFTISFLILKVPTANQKTVRGSA